MWYMALYVHVVQTIWVKPIEIANKMEQNNTTKYKTSDNMNHLNESFDHEFRWFVLSRSSKNNLKHKILEVYYTKTWNLHSICKWTVIHKIFLEMVWHRFTRCYTSDIFLKSIVVPRVMIDDDWNENYSAVDLCFHPCAAPCIDQCVPKVNVL